MENKDMPAFPAPDNRGLPPGLSKREIIAMAAMQGMLSNPKLDIETTKAETIAQDAIAQTDILLLELSKPQP